MSVQNWRTPDWLFQLLQKEIVKRKFKLDAAASPENALCKKYYTLKENGLRQPWFNATFCNPYYRDIGAWIIKAVTQARNRNLIACVIGPKGCSQEWFHLYAKQGTLYFPDQRLAFCDPETGQQTKGAREDSMIYVFGPGFWNKSETRFIGKPLNIRDLRGVKLGRPPVSATKRFWSMVDRRGPNACWLWAGSTFENGYGQFRYGAQTRAHRASYEINIGPILHGLFVCHTCDVKACVNPKHLWLGTNQENQINARDKGLLNPSKGDDHYKRRKKKVVTS